MVQSEQAIRVDDPGTEQEKESFFENVQLIRVKDRTRPRRNHLKAWGVIMAGGDGQRLKSLTRTMEGDERPKQFCRLLSDETLLAGTIRRTANLLPKSRTLIVLNQTHELYYRNELPGILGERRIEQPSNRGTLPAILWSLLKLQNAGDDAVVAFFPSDHHYTNERLFIARAEEALDSVDLNPGTVILLAASATHPETDYGWMELKPPAMFGGEVRAVSQFWEKPSPEFAANLMSRGCLWNTGVMIGHVRTFLDMIRAASPSLFKRFQLAFWLGTRPDALEKRMRLLYDDIECADFSKQVLMTQASRVAAFNIGDVGWTDLGDPARVMNQRAAHRTTWNVVHSVAAS